MAAKLILASEVERDFDKAYAWYEERRTGLGEKFLSCVDACIQAIWRNPEVYAIAFDSYRRGLVRRFPYAVFYEYSNETVTNLLCFSQLPRSTKMARTTPWIKNGIVADIQFLESVWKDNIYIAVHKDLCF